MYYKYLNDTSVLSNIQRFFVHLSLDCNFFLFWFCGEPPYSHIEDEPFLYRGTTENNDSFLPDELCPTETWINFTQTFYELYIRIELLCTTCPPDWGVNNSIFCQQFINISSHHIKPQWLTSIFNQLPLLMNP